MPRVMSAEEAVRTYIHDGATVAFGGFVGAMVPEEVNKTIQELFLSTGSPRGLTAIYAVWLSVLKMMEATGLDKKLSRGLRPIIRRLFKGEKDETYDHIAVNLSADMLGMGGVATAAGIKAMASMCPADGRATDNMLLLLVLNATSVQIIPATVIALRAAGGSSNAASVLLPTLISTTVATVTGGLLCKVFAAKDRHRPAAATCPPTPPRNDRRRSSARRPRKSAAIRRQGALATKDGTTP